MVALTDSRMEDLLIGYIVPFVGEYQFRFVALVNWYMYHAYTTVFPSKWTKFNDTTMAITNMCVKEFQSEKIMKACISVRNDVRVFNRIVKRNSKKGYITSLLVLAPHILYHNTFMEIASVAASRGHLSLLMWLYWYCHLSTYYDRPTDWDWNEVYIHAIKNNQFAVLTWIRDKTSRNIATIAAQCRNWDVLQWYLNNGWDLSVDVCSNAALRGDLELIQWAHYNGFPWDSKTCSNAALYGYFEIVQWLYANGCPWDAKTCSNAAINGHIEIVRGTHIRVSMLEKLIIGISITGHV
jgi:hypothetical protein